MTLVPTNAVPGQDPHRFRQNEQTRMNHNDVTKVSMAINKRKADVDAKQERPSAIELCALSAFDANTLRATKDEMVETSRNAQSTANVKRGKVVHSASLPSDTTNNLLAELAKREINENQSDGKNSSLPLSLQSRLQWLQNHSIMNNIMFFLDETDLFQLENAHSEMIGPLAIARHWSYLSSSDERKFIHAHNRWRPMNAMDVKAVGKNIESTQNEADIPKDEDACNKDNDRIITMNGYRCRKDLLARHIGQNFAKEALFVREREKEAEYIYNFDRTPTDENDVSIFKDHRSLTDFDTSSSQPVSSSQVASEREQYWCEWYDYRANSVNEQYAFVRFSLRDGSGRFWHGFRRLATNYNTTFFRLQFEMKELIKDMQWTELETYLKFNDATYTSTQNRLKAMEPLMRMTQLTVSIGGKLLVATGGYSPSFGGVAGNDKCYFHSRHYRLPLADTIKNDLQWMPYRICLEDNSAQNELVLQFNCDHANLPFMRAVDIGNPNANAHW